MCSVFKFKILVSSLIIEYRKLYQKGQFKPSLSLFHKIQSKKTSDINFIVAQIENVTKRFQNWKI